MEDFNFDDFNVVTKKGDSDKERFDNRQRVNRRINNPNKNTNNVEPKQSVKTSQNSVNKREKAPKKKKSKLIPIVCGLVIVASGVTFGVYKYTESKKLVPVEIDYTNSGRTVYDNLLSKLKNYDAYELDNIIGVDTGDSYLAQEWSYANNNEIRQNFIQSVCANLEFEYPMTPLYSTTGVVMTDDAGNTIMVNSPMNNGESFTVTHVDYEKLSATIEENSEEVRKLYLDSGLLPTDYDYKEKMIDLMLDYIISRGNLPLKETEISIQLQNSMIVDDIELDKLLFSSDDFHKMCDTFSMIATDFKTSDTVENEDYTKWRELFDQYYVSDNGVYTEGVSQWQPVYELDEDGNPVVGEDGTQVVDYYMVKDEDGNDWKQPSETIEVKIDFESESVIPYCFLGAYYCQNEYDGDYSPEVKVGDGTIEFPAGVGTPIITKCLGTDGNYHDIKVTLMGYWLGQDAIDYAVSFSEKNRGFDINSVIQLITYEVQIENLEKEPFTFTSDMFLADKNSNKSTRTGNMYGFASEIEVPSGGTVILNDWATSTEIEQKFVCWGSSFERKYPVVYFKVLAGEDDIPTYSAYKSFTGEVSNTIINEYTENTDKE